MLSFVIWLPDYRLTALGRPSARSGSRHRRPWARATAAFPAMRVADRDHHAQNVLPGLGIEHDRIRKHAAVPTDVLERARRLPVVASHPRAGVAHNIEFTVGVRRLAMAAGFVVRTGAL